MASKWTRSRYLNKQFDEPTQLPKDMRDLADSVVIDVLRSISVNGPIQFGRDIGQYLYSIGYIPSQGDFVAINVSKRLYKWVSTNNSGVKSQISVSSKSMRVTMQDNDLLKSPGIQHMQPVPEHSRASLVQLHQWVHGQYARLQSLNKLIIDGLVLKRGCRLDSTGNSPQNVKQPVDNLLSALWFQAVKAGPQLFEEKFDAFLNSRNRCRNEVDYEPPSNNREDSTKPFLSHKRDELPEYIRVIAKAIILQCLKAIQLRCPDPDFEGMCHTYSISRSREEDDLVTINVSDPTKHVFSLNTRRRIIKYGTWPNHREYSIPVECHALLDQLRDLVLECARDPSIRIWRQQQICEERDAEAHECSQRRIRRILEAQAKERKDQSEEKEELAEGTTETPWDEGIENTPQRVNAKRSRPFDEGLSESPEVKRIKLEPGIRATAIEQHGDGCSHASNVVTKIKQERNCTAPGNAEGDGVCSACHAKLEICDEDECVVYSCLVCDAENSKLVASPDRSADQKVVHYCIDHRDQYLEVCKMCGSWAQRNENVRCEKCSEICCKQCDDSKTSCPCGELTQGAKSRRDLGVLTILYEIARIDPGLIEDFVKSLQTNRRVITVKRRLFSTQ
eukprot:Colp12_sorted_trinity150504_noHs@17935